MGVKHCDYQVIGFVEVATRSDIKYVSNLKNEPTCFELKDFEEYIEISALE